MQDKNMPLNLIPAAGMKSPRTTRHGTFTTIMQDVQGLVYARGQNTGQMPTLSTQEKGCTSKLCQIITGYVRRHQKGLAAMQRLD